MSAPLDMAAVADLLGVEAATVAKWRVRYRDTRWPCPEPDGHLGQSPYWTDPASWLAWHASRPGRTGRPKASA